MIELVRREIELGRWLLSEKLITRFAHSVELFNDPKRGKLYPVYRVGDEFVYFGVDDTKKRFAYMRLTAAPYNSGIPFKIGSCAGSYIMDCPVRLVVFNDWETENRDQLITKILAVSFFSHVTLNRYSVDAMNLAKEESPIGEFEFGGKTFYLAIDLIIKIVLKRDDCSETCDPFPNPIC